MKNKTKLGLLLVSPGTIALMIVIYSTQSIQDILFVLKILGFVIIAFLFLIGIALITSNDNDEFIRQ